jgi:hypothetical protein
MTWSLLRRRARRARAVVASALVIAGVIAGVIASVAAPAPAAAQDSTGRRAPRPRRSSPLFASDTILRLTLVADFRALGNDRDTVRQALRPATVVYTGPEGQPVSVRGQVSTRGHFRLRRATCAFPPLRLVFPDTGTRGTLFARQRGLKLVTHCRDGMYEQHVLREYLAYRAHNILTPASFRPRLARIRYVDARDTTRVSERYGLFLESERELAERHGGKMLDEGRGALFDHLTPGSAELLALWEYFIGNTDWSLGALHNVRLVATDTGTFAVPYDFDFSGLVNTPYANPDPRLPIRNVRERLWRGPCTSATALVPLLELFHARRPAIRALYDSLPELDRRYARDAVKFIDEFYDRARDPGALAQSFKYSCQPGT